MILQFYQFKHIFAVAGQNSPFRIICLKKSWVQKCYLKKRWVQYNVGYNKNFMDIRKFKKMLLIKKNPKIFFF